MSLSYFLQPSLGTVLRPSLPYTSQLPGKQVGFRWPLVQQACSAMGAWSPMRGGGVTELSTGGTAEDEAAEEGVA